MVDLSNQDRPLNEEDLVAGPSPQQQRQDAEQQQQQQQRQQHEPTLRRLTGPSIHRPWSTDFANPMPDISPRRNRPFSELHASPSNATRPVRIRRLPSEGTISRSGNIASQVTPSSSLRRQHGQTISAGNPDEADEEEEVQGRRRSMSAPQRPTRVHVPVTPVRRDTVTNNAHLLPVVEERGDSMSLHRPSMVQERTPAQQDSYNSLAPPPSSGVLRRASNAAMSVFGSVRQRGNSIRRPRAPSISQWPNSATSEDPHRVYDDEVIDFLDVIDPEVSTLTTLNNVQNSLFIPYLGNFLNRQQTYDLTREETTESSSSSASSEDSEHEGDEPEVIPDHPAPATDPETTTLTEPEPDTTASLEKEATAGEAPAGWVEGEGEDEDEGEYDPRRRLKGLSRTDTLTSVLSGTSIGHRYAVLPHGTVLDNWTPEDKAMLNDHVRHLLHSRRARFKRTMRAFGKYVRTPLGCFVTVYAFLLTFWGAAWVFFLIGWIHARNRQAYFVEICDQILTALFALVGLGLAPFRAVDTYHMIYIAHYHRLTWRLRRERGLPDLADPNELPTPGNPDDLELAHGKELETVVLTPEQQRKLVHHQTKFSQSHTFYKPKETFTHRAFSIKILITIVVLLDCHSLFQMALGGTTWGIYYKHRPKALTAVILTCSICCNISGGIWISIGDRLSRKKEVVTQLARQALTEEAMKKIKKQRTDLRTFTRVKGVAGDTTIHSPSKKKSKRHSKKKISSPVDEDAAVAMDMPKSQYI